MQNLGDKKVGSTVYCYFDTYGSNMESVTISGLAVTDIEIYKNGSTTQRASDNGYTLLDTDGTDFDGTVGLHGFSVNTADNSDAGFYSAGAHYLINVNAITVNAQTVRLSFGFTLGDALYPGTAGRNITVDTSGAAQADITKILATAVNTGASAGYFPSDLLKIGNTNVGAGTDPIPADVTKWDGVDVNVALPASGTLAAQADCLTASGVRTALGLASANLDTQLAAKQATFTSSTGITYPSNFSALGINASGHITRVVLADTVTLTTTATTLTNLPTIPANWLTANGLAADAVAEIAAAIDCGDTGTGGGGSCPDLTDEVAALQVTVNAIKAKTDNLPTDPADASDIATSFASVNSTLATIAGYIDTEVAAIKVKTDNLPANTTTALALLATAADMIKVRRAVYDTITRIGNILTLSDGTTQTIDDDGRLTEE